MLAICLYVNPLFHRYFTASADDVRVPIRLNSEGSFSAIDFTSACFWKLAMTAPRKPEGRVLCCPVMDRACSRETPSKAATRRAEAFPACWGRRQQYQPF